MGILTTWQDFLNSGACAILYFVLARQTWFIQKKQENSWTISPSTSIRIASEQDTLSSTKQGNAVTIKCSSPQGPTRDDAMGRIQTEGDGLLLQTKSLLN